MGLHTPGASYMLGKYIKFCLELNMFIFFFSRVKDQSLLSAFQKYMESEKG